MPIFSLLTLLQMTGFGIGMLLVAAVQRYHFFPRLAANSIGHHSGMGAALYFQ
ncbi:hypothetical protein [Xenorhabdus budapestensis]|uniref:hypothetical protein n=1 Tax=Xenorhabdus budapestensis TaxID=290110 RepID=UPI001FCEA047|nr:hypothetical protein [Xenorhabdus budapestensis]